MWVARRRFLAYLLNHPVNRAMREMVPSRNAKASQAHHASWELVICLMRNIICHEYCYAWSSVREMMRISIAYFGERREVEQMLRLYATLVLDRDPTVRQAGAASMHAAQSVVPEPSNNSQGRYLSSYA